LFVTVRANTKNMGIVGGERTTRDPECVRDGDEKICSEDGFKLKQHPELTVGLYSSCMRRATETASVIQDTLKNKYKKQPDILILPFCREETNMLGAIGLDVLNTCVPDNMRRIMNTQNCEFGKVRR